VSAEPSITCPICAATSHHPEDVRQGYCGHCHAFTRDCSWPRCPAPGAVVFGNVAFCEVHAEPVEEAEL
jgi:hypothetical protein